jgi:hypothetical protein
MALIEGKQPMSFKGFKFLATKALKQKTDLNLAIFSHLYLSPQFVQRLVSIEICTVKFTSS